MSGFETYGAPYAGEGDDLNEMLADGDDKSDGEEEAAAWELLHIQNEGELESFLSKALKRFKGASPLVDKLVRNGARSLVKRVLPIGASAIGTAFAPGPGTAAGGIAGSLLSQILGSEADAMGEADAQLEAARRIVRTITDAANRVT